MPATETFWRNLKWMHLVFAVSSVAMLGATVWMLAADYDDEWRATQRTFEEVEAQKLDRELAAAKSGEYTEKRSQLESELAEKKKAAQAELASGESERRQLVDQAAELQRQVDLAERAVRLAREARDVARANYDLAVRDNRDQATLEGYMAEFRDKERRVNELQLALEKEQMQLDEKRKRLEQANKDIEELNAAIGQLDADVDRLQAAKSKIAPDTWSFSGLKREIMTWPIIDGFNSPRSVKQLWLPDLSIKLGMAKSARFDRCTTCHMGIDRVETGNVPTFPHGEIESDSVAEWVEQNKFPHPYATHPRPDLYLTASSPHPMTTFGCTICHEGQGSGTSFSNAAHYPNDPHEMEEWAAHHNFQTNHFWEYPMYPERFSESSCIKCHHNVVELGVNPTYGPSAPKVYKGYELLTTYGCFGCHEIQGYDGTRPIGPDIRLEPQTAEEAEKYASDPNMIAGKMRKVGPSLRHIGSKTTQAWVEYWTDEPKRFRPDTRMPQFFHLTNQEDPHAALLQPVELAGIAQYLFDNSQPLELLTPEQGYQANVERGRMLFSRRGCLACHSHEAFPDSKADFGPELSRVHAKIKPGEEGFNWVYTWVREPTRHHPRTKMPNAYLEPYEEGGQQIDPAADIAAFLLEKGPAEYQFAQWRTYLGAEFDPEFAGLAVGPTGGEATPHGARVVRAIPMSPAARTVVRISSPGSGEEVVVDDPLREGDVIIAMDGQPVTDAASLSERVATMKSGQRVMLTVWRNEAAVELEARLSNPLDDLARLFLSKALTNPQVEDTMETRKYPFSRAQIKGDEIELTQEAAGVDISDEDWERMKLNYVGRRTISRYGCFGCHDIPGFEDARPIGTTLQDWGRKDVSRLAPEHIAEYLHHHGEPDGSSTADRVHTALRKAQGGGTEAGEFASEQEAEREMSAAYFYESLLHHERPGFLWQKLRQPRSYDYEKMQTKGYDERLRMPKFPFDEEQIEAIATFVLGLVAEPPSTRYLYRPDGPAYARIEGERLLEQFNCVGCHMVELPEVHYGVDPNQLAASELLPADHPEAHALLVEKIKPAREARTGATMTVGAGEEKQTLPVISFHGLVRAEPDPLEDEEFQLYSFDLWETLKVDDKELLPGAQPMIVPVKNLEKIEPARGGSFAEWLVKQLIASDTQGNRSLAWQMAPPPLYREGVKVQTPWLYQFLRDPPRLRHTTVLRMPRFNLDAEEAQTLANYFAAVDGAPYPYQEIPQREPEYLAHMNQELGPTLAGESYLNESWNMLNAQVCIKCHSLGGRQFQVSDPKTDIRGPNLQYAHDRLRPDWLYVWMAKPAWITPYTSMPQVFPHNQTQYTEFFGGNATAQTRAVRDALLNYNRLMEEVGVVESAPATPPAGNNGTQPPGGGANPEGQ